jgi:hypothetical protein
MWSCAQLQLGLGPDALHTPDAVSPGEGCHGVAACRATLTCARPPPIQRHLPQGVPGARDLPRRRRLQHRRVGRPRVPTHRFGTRRRRDRGVRSSPNGPSRPDRRRLGGPLSAPLSNGRRRRAPSRPHRHARHCAQQRRPSVRRCVRSLRWVHRLQPGCVITGTRHRRGRRANRSEHRAVDGRGHLANHSGPSRRSAHRLGWRRRPT